MVACLQQRDAIGILDNTPLLSSSLSGGSYGYSPGLNLSSSYGLSNYNLTPSIPRSGSFLNNSLGNNIDYVQTSDGKIDYFDDFGQTVLYNAAGGYYTHPNAITPTEPSNLAMLAAGAAVVAPQALPALASMGAIGSTAAATLGSPYVAAGTTLTSGYITEEYARATYYSHQAGDTIGTIENGVNALLWGTGAGLGAYATARALPVPAVRVAASNPDLLDSSVFQEIPFELPSRSIRIGARPRLITSQEIAGVGFDAAPVIQRSNAQLVRGIASRAEAWAIRQGITGSPADIGKSQHSYADRLLRRYQQMFGDRGLRSEISVMNQRMVPRATKGSVRLDVLDGNVANPHVVYDYKFGSAGLTADRINEIRSKAGYGAGIPVLEVRP